MAGDALYNGSFSRWWKKLMTIGEVRVTDVSYSDILANTLFSDAGWYLVVGYARGPERFNTVVVYADNRSQAKMQLTAQYPNTLYDAVFVTRQEHGDT